MKAAPRPDELDRLLEEVRTETHRVLEAYRWCWGVAHGQTRLGMDGSRSPVGRSDPTGGVVADDIKEEARDELRNAEKRVIEAFNALVLAADKLHESMDPEIVRRRRQKQRYKGRDYEPVQRLRPSGLTRAEMAESLEAKRRREDRGEGWGEG